MTQENESKIIQETLKFLDSVEDADEQEEALAVSDQHFDEFKEMCTAMCVMMLHLPKVTGRSNELPLAEGTSEIDAAFSYHDCPNRRRLMNDFVRRDILSNPEHLHEFLNNLYDALHGWAANHFYFPAATSSESSDGGPSASENVNSERTGYVEKESPPSASKSSEG